MLTWEFHIQIFHSKLNPYFYLAGCMNQCRSKLTSFCEATLGRLAVLLHMIKMRRDYHLLFPGYTFLTHSFILAGECPRQCEHSQCVLTVSHILMRCPHLKPVRDGVFRNEGVMESFRFHSQLIITFLREIES